MNIALKTFYREILGAISSILIGFFLIFITLDGLNEMHFIGRLDYTWKTLAQVVLLRAPEYTYQLLPICTLIGGILALSSMAARSELVVWRASGLSVRRMVAIIASLGMLLAFGAVLIGEAGIVRASQTSVKIKKAALHSNSYFDNGGGFWSRQLLADGTVRMINVRTLINATTPSDIRVYELTPDFALKNMVLAKTADAAAPSSGQWLLHDVQRLNFGLNDSQVVVAQGEEHLAQLAMDWGENNVQVLRSQDQTMLAIPSWQLWQRIHSLKAEGQRSRDYEIGFWQKLFYPLNILAMVLLTLPFAFMQTRKGGVGMRVMTGIFLGLVFFILSSMVQFLGPLLTYPPMVVAGAPVVLFLAIALGWLWRVTHVV